LKLSTPTLSPPPLSILLSVHRYLQLDTDDLPVEPHLLWARPPWTKPQDYQHPEQHNWERLGSASKRDHNNTLKAHKYSSSQLQQVLKTHASAPLITLIFTDGSATGTGGGSGVVIYTSVHPHNNPPSLAILKSFPLGPICSNNLAELYAIQKGLEIVLSIDPPPPPQAQIHIFTDSQYAATVTELGYIPHSTTYWHTIKRITALRRSLSRISVHTSTHWTPGHCDFQPNDLADSQANGAALHSTQQRFPSPVPIPYQLAKSEIAKRTAAIWDKWWRLSTSMAEVAHQTHPTASWKLPLKLLSDIPRKLQVAFTRVSIGNAPTNNIVAPLNNTSAQCDHCPATDSTKHRLFLCAHYTAQRNILQHDTGMHVLSYSSLFNLQAIPNSARSNHISTILKFITSTDLESVFVRTNIPSAP
jgi:ribonuclease HI